MEGQKTIRVAEFFAGVGGFRAAFEHLPSFKFVFVNDIDPTCKITYDANFHEPKMTLGDIRSLSIDEIPDFDMMIGGFPCQSFSIIGNRKGEDDERGRLFYNLLDIIDVKRPSLVLFENVKGLVFMNKGAVFHRMLDELRNRGYTVYHTVLDTCVHSHIPQHRQRVFIVGHKGMFKRDFQFPFRTLHGPDHISNFLEPPGTVDKRYIYTPEKNPKSYGILKEALVGDGIPLYHFHHLWSCTELRRKRIGCCETLLAGMSRGGHSIPVFYDGTDIRCLTPRECFNLQGFPSTFILPHGKVRHNLLYKQAGNAVTVAVARLIANCIYYAMS